MNKQRVRVAAAAVVTFALIGAACGSDDDSSSEPSDTSASTEAPGDSTGGGEPGDCETIDEISLQLQWFTQAQFAGYYAAQDQGFYEDMCLDVTIVEGGVEIVPQTQLANGDVDFALAWVPKALASREAGADITNIAQIYQRSGTLQVSFADAGITTPADFAGKNIGNWGFGNEYEVFAAIGQAGLDPATDVTLVGQQFDMVALLDGSIDAAEAMTYNEYAQVLETVNPDTGELYQPEDFNVISYEEIGVGMLQDAIWADCGSSRRRPGVQGSGDAIRCCVHEGLGVLPRQSGGVPRHRGGGRFDARSEPSAVAGQRGQQADLAVTRRDRLHRCQRVGPHRRDQPEHTEPRRRHRADSTADRWCVHQRDRRGRVGDAHQRGSRSVRRHASSPSRSPSTKAASNHSLSLFA